MTTLAEYNNNPGNLKPPGGKANFYEGQIGVDGNGFAVFETQKDGRKALIDDLTIKINRGVNTPEQFIDIYSPAGPENEETGRDNYKIYLAHQLGLKSTGDKFSKEHIEKLADAVTAFEGGTWAGGQKEQGGAKEGTAEESIYPTNQPSETAEASPYGEDVIPDSAYDYQKAAQDRLIAGGIGGATGFGLGTIYSAKAPVVRVAQRVGLLPGGKPITKADAVELAGRIVPPEVDANTPGGKWGAKTGFGIGEGTVQETSSRYQRNMPQGKVSGPFAKKWGIAQPGESRDVLQRMIDRKNAAEKAATPSAKILSGLGQIGRIGQAILGSTAVKGGLAGFNIGQGIQDVSQRMKRNEIGEAIASGLSTAASTVAPFASGALNVFALPFTAGIPLYLGASDRLKYLEQHPDEIRLENPTRDALGNVIMGD